jgi:hypothetical protein
LTTRVLFATFSSTASASVQIFGNNTRTSLSVPSGNTVLITWTSTDAKDGTCSIAGPNAQTLFYNGGEKQNSTGVMTLPLTNTSRFYLMCVNLNTNAVDSDMLLVSISTSTPVVNPQTSPTTNTSPIPTVSPNQTSGNTENVLILGPNTIKNGRGTQLLYFPDELTNSTSLFIGDGGKYSVHTSDTSPNNLTTYYNLGVGMRSLQLNTTGSYNTAIGFEAMNYNDVGSYNTAVGEASLIYNKSGNYNTALGWKALLQNVSGKENTAVGSASMLQNLTGTNNTSVGQNSLYYSTNGNYNTAIGNMSLVNSQGDYNTGLGAQSMLNLKTGNQNLGIGFGSMYNLSNGNSNVAIGGSSMYDLINGANNTVVGFLTGRGIKTGNNNTIIGSNISNLPENLSNNIIISDGSGNKRLRVDSNGNVYFSGPKICLNNTCFTETQLIKLLNLVN